MFIHELIASIVILLGIAVAMLSIFALVARGLDQLREARRQSLQSDMQNSIQKFLTGDIALDVAAKTLRQDRDVALDALVSAFPAVAPALQPALKDLSGTLHVHEHLLAALRHRNGARRNHAAVRLGILQDREAIPALTHALSDALLDVRLAAALALARMGAVHTLRPILRSLAMPSSWPLQLCAEILHQMGPSAIEPLRILERWGRLPATANAVVVQTLGMLGAAAAVPTLVNSLNHVDDQIRVSTAKALGQICSNEAVQPLCNALNDPQWPVRSAAAKALGQLRDHRAIPALAEKLADSAWWVRFNAAEALYRLEGITELHTAMTHHSDTFARDISRQILEECGTAKGTYTAFIQPGFAPITPSAAPGANAS